MTESQPEQTPVEEIWLFGGLRRLSGSGYAHGWIDRAGEGELLLYKAKGSFVVGSLYAVQVSRTADNTRMHGTPRYHGRCDDAELRATVEATHDAVKARQARERMERNDAKNKAIDNAVAPLVEIARTLPTHADKDAFAAYVLRKIIDAWH